MKNLITKAAIVSAMMAAPSFAIFGLGAHYAPAFHTLDAKNSAWELTNEVDKTGQVNLFQGEATKMEGFGFKFWIDIIPVIDIEASMNINFANYSTDLQFSDADNNKSEKVALSPDFDFAGVAVPNYFQAVSDLTVNYPVFDVIPMLTPYVGAGVSYFAGTPVADKAFVKDFLNKNPNLEADLETRPEQVAEEIAEKLASDGFTTAVGGHVQAGIRFKPVIIPFAIYANSKYYFGDLHEAVSQGALFELGGGIAF